MVAAVENDTPLHSEKWGVRKGCFAVKGHETSIDKNNGAGTDLS